MLFNKEKHEMHQSKLNLSQEKYINISMRKKRRKIGAINHMKKFCNVIFVILNNSFCKNNKRDPSMNMTLQN